MVASSVVFMSTSGLFIDTVEGVAEVARARARSEFVEIDALVCLTEFEAERVERLYNARAERLESAAVVGALAAELHQSERTIAARVFAGRFLVRWCVRTWAAFAAGDVDWAKASAIAGACRDLSSVDAVEDLEERAAVYAAGHTPVQLRRWLEIEVARLEPQEVQPVDPRAGRRVHRDRVGDGTSWLNILLADVVADAVESKLERTVTSLPDATDDGPDERTTDQKKADVVAAWLTHGESTDPVIAAQVGIVVPWTVLTGDSQAPGVSTDGDHPLPASQVREVADLTTTKFFWCGLGPDGRIRDVRNALEVVHQGRFAPDSLRRAVVFRDGVCQAPGCTRRAENCDYDHRTPHPGGATSGTNIWPLCRLHHLMKTHGLLVPVELEPGRWGWRFSLSSTIHDAEPAVEWEPFQGPPPPGELQLIRALIRPSPN